MVIVTYSIAITNGTILSQLSNWLGSRRGSVFGGFVHHLQRLRSTFAEDRTDGPEVAGDEGAFAGPVVVQVTVDGSDMVGEIDNNAGQDHREEREKKGIEDELFRGGKHVDSEGHLILIDLQTNPANQRTCDPE